MTLANQLTILRICLVPVLVILLVYGLFGYAIIVFFIAGITDALDGFFARIRHEKTDLGTMLDPLADKLLVTSSLIVLSLPSEALTVRIPPWIAILSISRDAGILLAVLVFNLAVGPRVFRPRLLGKATTVAHLTAILWVIFCNYKGQTYPLTQYLLGAVVVLVAASGVQYLHMGHQVLSEAASSSEHIPGTDGE